MYDATQGANSGAHIGVITKSGTNEMHGQVYWRFQNSDMNAAPFFYNASPIITQKVPFLNRNQFGATLGGPIKKNKLFYFVSYQGVRIADATDATKDVTVPLGLTNDRSVQGIINAVQCSFGTTLTPSQVSPVSLGMLQAKLPNGQYLIPSAQITNPDVATALGYDAVTQGPNAQSTVDQGIANVDYVVNDKDRLSVKYYIQNNPTTNPFGSVGSALGFPQQLSGRQPSRLHRQHRHPHPRPDLAAARWIHSASRLRADGPGIHTGGFRHESARINGLSANPNQPPPTPRFIAAFNSEPAPVLATPACIRINGNTEHR